MPDVDFGALTIPIFVTIWAGGWASCYLVLVKPLTARLEKLETKQNTVEQRQEEELRMLRQKVYGG